MLAEPVLIKVDAALNWSPLPFPNISQPEPALVAVKAPLKMLLPALASLVAPVFVMVVANWNVAFLAVNAAEVILTIQFIVTALLPKVVVVAPVTLRVPFCTVPNVNCAVVPLTVNVPAFRSRVPLVNVRLLMLTLAPNLQVLLPVTMVTLSAAPGTPLGAQLAAVFHDVDDAPVQV